MLRSRTWIIAALATVACGLFLAMGGLEATALRQPDYEGSFSGPTNESSVEIGIVRASGMRFAKFRAEGLRIYCDDGTRPRIDFRSFRFRFVNKDTFFDHYRFDDSDGSVTFYDVRGQLQKNGRRVSGYVDYLKNAPDPPPVGGSDEPDCATVGPARWEARRVTGSR